MHKWLLLAATYYCIWPVYGQETSSFSNGQSSLERIRELTHEATEVMNHDPDKARKITEEALQLSKALRNDTATINNYNNLAVYFFSRNNHKAIQFFDSAALLSRKINDSLRWAKALTNIGNVNYQMADYAKSVIHATEALLVLEAIGREDLTPAALIALGLSHHKQGQYEEAEEFFLQSEEILLEQKNDYGLTVVYNNLGNIYQNKRSFEESIFYLQKSLEIAKRNNNVVAQGIVLDNLGNCYHQLENSRRAIALYESAFEIHQQMNNVQSMALNCANRGLAYLMIGNVERARDLATLGLTYTEESGAPDQKDNLYKLLAYVSIYNKDLGNALKYHYQHLRIEDSLYSEGMRSRISELQTRFETDKKEKELVLERERSQLLRKEKEYATLSRNFILVSSLLVVVMLLFLVLLLKSRNEKKEGEKKSLASELDYKNRELVSSIMHLASKNQLMAQIEQSIKNFQLPLNGASKPIKELQRIIRSSTQVDNTWKQMVLHFQNVHPAFFDKLNAGGNDLTQNELKHCAYIKLKLNTKETASIFNISPKGVEISRYRIKKKLGLAADVDLHTYIDQL